MLCAAKHWSPFFTVVTKAPESAIVVNRNNTHGFCFSTSCLWPLQRASLPSVLQRGEINTFNVMCGQWNKGMIYVGMATPQIRWVMCLVAGRGEGRRGDGTMTQSKTSCKRLKKCGSLLLIVAPFLSSLHCPTPLFASLKHTMLFDCPAKSQCGSIMRLKTGGKTHKPTHTPGV